jgi:hypothetical protein
MLGMPPEVEYLHVRQGLATLGTLGVLLLGLVAWRLDHLPTVMSALAAAVVLGGTCCWAGRRYRHGVAGILVLVVLLGLLSAAAHHHGYLEQVAALGDLTAAVRTDSSATR